MVDIGFTHIALPASNIDASLAFYKKYANMEVVHERTHPKTGVRVVWIGDHSRPFVLVLIEMEEITVTLDPIAHMGVGVASTDRVDELCALAKEDGCLVYGPKDSGPPVGYFALMHDPDGHTLEVAFGQEVGLAMQKLEAANSNEKDGVVLTPPP